MTPREKAAVDALRVYARRYELEGGACWNWTLRVCDSFSGEVAHFDYSGSEADAPWEIAERALAALNPPPAIPEKTEPPVAGTYDECEESSHSDACIKRMYEQAGVTPPAEKPEREK